MATVYNYGIDISSWQGDIDLEKLNPGFVIIRAGCGKNRDSKAIRNMDLCEKLGIPYGVYWYSYALTVEAAREEARLCLSMIDGRKIDVGVWFDMEDADGYKARNNAIRKELTGSMCYAFAEMIEQAGYYAGIYSSLSWIQGGYIDGCERFDKWVACWGSNSGKLTTDTERYGSLHQYAGDIQKDGYNLDFNVSYVPLSHYRTKEAPVAKPDDGNAESLICKPEFPILREGSSGGYVKMLQRQLISLGYNCGGKKDLWGVEKPDGQFGSKTKKAVQEIQRKHKLPDDGVVEALTWAVGADG